MKRYYFTWYNHVAQATITEFILAEDETQAKQMAVLIMKLYGGDLYNINDIENINELNDNYFFTMERLEEKCKVFKKEFVLPEIEEDEDDD